MTNEITVSLVTFNQVSFLKIFLEDYKDYSFNFDSPIPLLVVNDGSTDGTKGLLLEKQKIYPWLLIRNVSHIGISAGRNIALNCCPSKWIAFTDTDCKLSEKYFEVLEKIPEQYGEYIAVEGRVQSDVFSLKNSFYHKMENRLGGMYATANMIFNVAATLQLGGFDERFGNFREDVDLGLRISKIKSIPFIKELAVRHPHISRNFLKDIKNSPKKIRNIVRSEYLLYNNHPTDYKYVRAFPSFQLTMLNTVKKHFLSQFKALYLDVKPFMIFPKINQIIFTPLFLLKAIQLIIISVFEHLLFVLYFLWITFIPIKDLKSNAVE